MSDNRDASDSGDDTSAGSGAPPHWVSDAQDALRRTGDAIKTAWDATRDNRVAALESAKEAARELGDVIDKGIDTARDRWSAASDTSDEATEESPVVETVEEETVLETVEETVESVPADEHDPDTGSAGDRPDRI